MGHGSPGTLLKSVHNQMLSVSFIYRRIMAFTKEKDVDISM
jgi:hypothetical protein